MRDTLQYGSLSVVSAIDLDFPITIGFVINYEGQTRKDIVCQLLDQISKSPIEIDCLLVDGGLASKASIEYLNDNKIRWVVQGKNFKKGYIGDSGTHFSNDLTDLSGVKSFVVESIVNGKKEQLLLLSSTLLKISIEEILHLYELRFQINKTYPVSRGARIRPTTQKVWINWVVWASSQYLELMWNII